MDVERYAKQTPATDKEIISALSRLMTEQDSVKDDRRHANQKLDRLRTALHDALEARERGDKVYVLTDSPFVTNEPPDAQQSLLGEGGEAGQSGEGSSAPSAA